MLHILSDSFLRASLQDTRQKRRWNPPAHWQDLTKRGGSWAGGRHG